MNKEKIIDVIYSVDNPYPRDIFMWNNKGKIILTRGRFNEFIHNVVENTRLDIIKLIKEEFEDLKTSTQAIKKSQEKHLRKTRGKCFVGKS